MSTFESGPRDGHHEVRATHFVGQSCSDDECSIGKDEPVVRIHTRSGRVVLFDRENFDLVAPYSWSINGLGYARGTALLPGIPKNIAMHRLIMGLFAGDPREVDHINGNPSDNRVCNLRICTHADNMRNRAKHRTRNKYKGVHKEGARFRAAIRANGESIKVGVFDTEEEAHAAYCKAATELHGEFANHGTTPVQKGFSDGPYGHGRILPLEPEVLEYQIGESLESLERRVILATLKHFSGVRWITAKSLGVADKTLYLKLKKYGVAE